MRKTAYKLPKGMNLQAEMKLCRISIVVIGLSVTADGLVIFMDFKKYRLLGDPERHAPGYT